LLYLTQIAATNFIRKRPIVVDLRYAYGLPACGRVISSRSNSAARDVGIALRTGAIEAERSTLNSFGTKSAQIFI